MAVVLLEAGLAKLQTAFGADKIADAHLLMKAEQSPKQRKLKVSNSMLIDYNFLFPTQSVSSLILVPVMGELC